MKVLRAHLIYNMDGHRTDVRNSHHYIPPGLLTAWVILINSYLGYVVAQVVKPNHTFIRQEGASIRGIEETVDKARQRNAKYNVT